MPQLHYDAPALGMHGVDNPPPACYLLRGVDAGRARQQRDDDAIGKVEVTDADVVEQGRHGRSLQKRTSNP
jgi:hypothetical protein